MENNGRGIFYGVIGVATLVVAIIGATFAYFSASAGGNETVTTGGATIDLKWSENVDLIQDNLIPIETGYADTYKGTDGQDVTQTLADDAASAFASYTNLDPSLKDTTWCQDNTGYNICSAYSITIDNDGSAPISLDGSFTSVNNGVEHLKFAIFRGTAEQVFATTAKWDVNNTTPAASYFAEGVTDGALLVSATDAAATGAANEVNGKLDITLGAVDSGTETATFTILLWIEEIGTTQNSGGAFTGKVNFQTADGTGITGVIA